MSKIYMIYSLYISMSWFVHALHLIYVKETKTKLRYICYDGYLGDLLHNKRLLDINKM